MLDQAQRLRELAGNGKKSEKDSNAHRPRIITVASGKGGVGKSNFVVNTAITLQKKGNRVLIFDADVGMANDDVLMGFLPKYNIYDIILKDKEVSEVLMEGPFGIKLLPGGSGLSKIKELNSVQRDILIEKLESLEEFDYIFIDTGAGVNLSILGFVSCSDEFIVITTPEPTSLMDAYSLIKAVNHYNIKKSFKVVVNRVMNNKEGAETFTKFNQAVSKFLKMNIEFLGFINEDTKLVMAVRKQAPFVVSFPNSKATRDIDSIADKLLNSDENKNNSTKTLFKKIFSIFS